MEKPRACDPLRRSYPDPRYLYLIDPYKVLADGVIFISVYLTPFLAFIFLKEQVDLKSVVGALLITAGCVLMLMK